MTHFSLIDRIQNDKAIRTLWSPNPAERAMAATFLRLGDQLEAQWETNDLQRRLCRIAVRTNDMLSDMGDSLDELRAGQEKTNELLAKSLAVQTDHYMLEKRQRVLKDALFRWNDLLTTGEGISDPHWVLVASRTFLEFLKTWDFTTEDLEDANEKRSLLGVMKHAKGSIKDTPQEIVAEVNVFQTIYGEHASLIVAGPKAPPSVVDRQSTEWETVRSLLIQHMQVTPPNDGPWDIYGLPNALLFMDDDAGPKKTQAAVLRGISKKIIRDDESILFAIYTKPVITGIGGLLRAAVFGDLAATFTTRRWYEYSCDEARKRFPSGGDKHFPAVTYLYRRGFRPLFEGKTLNTQMAQVRQRAENFVRAMADYRSNAQRQQDELRKDREHEARAREAHEAAVAMAAQEHAAMAAKAASAVNAYLDLHPCVEQFYPRIADS